MAKARYYKSDGKKGKARDLPGSLFDGVVNEDVLHQAVTAYLANQRQGTAAAKNRSAVRGGSRKPWRQKGTGRARQGTIRAVQWAGGGRAFPPIPHSWRQKLPRRVKVLARRSAFNVRAEGDRVVLADLPDLEAPRTREMRVFLEALEAADDKVLLLTDGVNRTLHLSVRNLPGVSIMPFGQESVYDLLQADLVVVERSALDGIEDEAPEAKAEPAPPAEAEEVEAENTPSAEAEEAEADEAPSAEAEDAAGDEEGEAADDEDEETSDA